MGREEDLERRVAQLETELAALRRSRGIGVRRRSAAVVAGLPLWDVALGPDPAQGQMRGHARGIVAVGDIATGLLAIGGFARGVVAVGGLALGFVSFGGLALGVVLAVGGGAVGTVAVGGGAMGRTAAGGAAVGEYACGGGAFGTHVIGPQRRDPEAVERFEALGLGFVCAGVEPQRRRLERMP